MTAASASNNLLLASRQTTSASEMPSQVQRLGNFPNFTHQAYRYGIALSCIGVLLNWLGVAQAYIEPVRYLGVGLVIIGSFLIIAAMCRWMFVSPQATTTTAVQEVSSDGAGDLHVITVPMVRGQAHSRTPGTSASQTRPPDYFLVTEKPPSYEEAMSMLPPYPATRSGSLQLNAEGGLQDFLAPHQVPESQPEGAVGGSQQQPDARTQQSDGCMESERLLNTSSSPPAYSQCASHSTFGSSNNSSTITPQEGNIDDGTADSTRGDNRAGHTSSTNNSIAHTTSAENRTNLVSLSQETLCDTAKTEETGEKAWKISSDSIDKCQKSDSSHSLSDQTLPSVNMDK